MPKEYKEYVQKEKKYTSKAAFIQNKGLEREYENRCFESEAARQQQELEREGIVTYHKEHLYQDEGEGENLAAQLN